MRNVYVLMLLVLCALSYNAWASTKDAWVGTTGNFSDGTQWDQGGPSAWTSGGEIEFNTADTDVTVNDGPWDFTSDMVFEFWGDATMRITAGADLGVRKLYLGIGDVGNIIQTGGAFAVDADDCHFGAEIGGVGNYTISGGSFYAKKMSLSSAVGMFTVIGDGATISTQRLYLGSDRSENYGTGTLEFQIGTAGVSPIEVTGEFHLDEGSAGSTANLLVSTNAVLGTDDIVLINLTDSGTIDGGLFDTLNGGSAAEGTQIALGGNTYSLTYAYDVGGTGHYNDVALVFEGQSGPAKAHTPNPIDEDIVYSSLDSLDWINPDPGTPGTPIYCTVYLGTVQDRSHMDSVTLNANESDVLINTTNFPTYGSLVNQAWYYWAVDVYDSSIQPEPIEGTVWRFYVYDDIAPAADAGVDQIAWLGKSGTSNQEEIDLDGTTWDDGPYTISWTQVDNGAPTVIISPDDVDDTSVTVTERGTYEFMLTADDGVRQTSDMVHIIVGDDSCDASHMSTGAPYDAEDINQDCIVNLADFAILFSEDWLVCTDTLTNCGN